MFICNVSYVNVYIISMTSRIGMASFDACHKSALEKVVSLQK